VAVLQLITTPVR